MSYVFHGTNAKLLDDGLVACTFFTTDLSIALKYGDTLYVMDMNRFSQATGLFTIDHEGYYISRCFIPLEYLIILKHQR